MTMTTTAREYARSSKGKGNRSKSTEDQHADNLRAEQEFGPWTWGPAYADTGSASKFATRNRDDFDRLTADLASGAFGAPGTILVLWEISRLSREMGVGTKIVDLCETGGYKIHVTSEERTYNPSNYNDRYALQAGINDAEREARRLSKRTKRGVDSNVNATDDNGDPAARPHGIIPFGYQRETAYVDGRPRPVRQFEQPEEAEIIRELFRRVLAGDSIMSVSRDFTARGITSRPTQSRPKGVPFSPQTLRVMLTHDAYRGYRVHKGKTIKASWPAIVDDATWHGVQALLADPSRRSHTGAGIKHELSMILRCGVCGGPMTVTYRRAQKTPLPPAYQCRDKACTRINKDGVDDLLIGNAERPGLIMQFLTSPYIYRSPADEESDELTAVRGELAAKERDLKETQQAEAATLAEERRMAAREERLENEIKELQARRDQLTPRPSTGDRLDLGPDAALAEAWSSWESAPLTVRRALAAELLNPDQFGTAVVMRAPAMGTVVPAAERIRFVDEDGRDVMADLFGNAWITDWFSEE